MTEIIKPCPFCGSSAEVGPVYDYDDRRAYLARVECLSCSVVLSDGLCFSDYINHLREFGKEETEKYIQELAIKYWNRRHGEDRLRAQRARMAKALIVLAKAAYDSDATCAIKNNFETIIDQAEHCRRQKDCYTCVLKYALRPEAEK